MPLGYTQLRLSARGEQNSTNELVLLDFSDRDDPGRFVGSGPRWVGLVDT